MLNSIYYETLVFLKTVSLYDIFILFWGFLFFIISIFIISTLPDILDKLKSILILIFTICFIGGSYWLSNTTHNYYKGVIVKVKDAKRLIYGNNLLINYNIHNIGKYSLKKCYYRVVVTHNVNLLNTKIKYKIMNNRVILDVSKEMKIKILPDQTVEKQLILDNFTLDEKFKTEMEMKCI